MQLMILAWRQQKNETMLGCRPDQHENYLSQTIQEANSCSSGQPLRDDDREERPGEKKGAEKAWSPWLPAKSSRGMFAVLPGGIERVRSAVKKLGPPLLLRISFWPCTANQSCMRS
mmetsp:Transcript_70231/g.139085  ORF Transcript_70231/g.139085 Transcript_70231/m.139085 type:complete len:116 (-) Transcript_70231:577-924(-)